MRELFLLLIKARLFFSLYFNKNTKYYNFEVYRLLGFWLLQVFQNLASFSQDGKASHLNLLNIEHISYNLY